MDATSAKKTSCTEGMSEEEWKATPTTFHAPTMARIACADLRYIQNHAAEFGGRKVAGKWLFSKAKVAELLGL